MIFSNTQGDFLIHFLLGDAALVTELTLGGR